MEFLHECVMCEPNSALYFRCSAVWLFKLTLILSTYAEFGYLSCPDTMQALIQ